MKNNINISIIVANYNCEQYIEKCLLSILHQTYPFIEVLFIDNNSTDNSLAIAQKIQKQFPDKLFIFQEKKQGVSATRNLGLNIAKGKYIAFVDADDFVSKTYLADHIENIEKYQADLSECSRYDILAPNTYKLFSTIKKEFLSLHDKNNIHLGTLFIWDKLFKKEIIENINLRFDETIFYSEDALFLFTYKLYCQKITYIQAPNYYYNKIRQTSFSNTNKDIENIIPMLKKMIEISKQHNTYQETIHAIGSIAAGYYIRRTTSFLTIPYPNKKKFIIDFLQFFKDNIPNWQLKVISYKSQNKWYKKIINLYRCTYYSMSLFLFYKKTILNKK